MPCPIDQIELVLGSDRRGVTQLSYVEKVADLAELLGVLLAPPVDIPITILDAERRGALLGIKAVGGTVPAFVHLDWPWGELQEFDNAWAGKDLNRFEMRFRDRMLKAGVSSPHARFICSALDEMIGNAQEHASAQYPGLATFEVTRHWWMFSVTDFGVGIPSRLRENLRYACLHDPDAISQALEHGVSTSSEEGRGLGFAQVFRALADRAAKLRVRSGRGLVTWEGLVAGTGTRDLSPRLDRQGTHIRAAARIRK